MNMVKEAWQAWQATMKEYAQKYNENDPELTRFKKEILSSQKFGNSLQRSKAIGVGLQKTKLVVENRPKQAREKRDKLTNIVSGLPTNKPAKEASKQTTKPVSYFSNKWAITPKGKDQSDNGQDNWITKLSPPFLRDSLTSPLKIPSLRNQEQGVIGPGYSFQMHDDQLKAAAAKQQKSVLFKNYLRPNSRKDVMAADSSETIEGLDKLKEIDPFDINFPSKNIDLMKYQKILTPLLFGGKYFPKTGGRTR
jgi:site-specific DNA-cytosine methylase